MLKYCDKDGIEKTIIDNENINDYVSGSGSGSGSGVSDEWKSSIESSIRANGNSINSLNNKINSLNNTVNSHGNSINSLNNSVNGLNGRQNIRVSLSGSTLYINW